jgi:hypothetical protein
MSNGVPATARGARQDGGSRAQRQPTIVGLSGARAYLDPRRDLGGYVLASRSDAIVEARITAIEDARMDCRSTILRNTPTRPG